MAAVAAAEADGLPSSGLAARMPDDVPGRSPRGVKGRPSPPALSPRNSRTARRAVDDIRYTEERRARNWEAKRTDQEEDEAGGGKSGEHTAARGECERDSALSMEDEPASAVPAWPRAVEESNQTSVAGRWTTVWQGHSGRLLLRRVRSSPSRCPAPPSPALPACKNEQHEQRCRNEFNGRSWTICASV